MAIFKCVCGLITSTPGRTAQCVRCRRVLGTSDCVTLPLPRDRVDGLADVPHGYVRPISNEIPEGLGQVPAVGCR